MSLLKPARELAVWQEIVSEKTAQRFVCLPAIQWPSAAELAQLRSGDVVTAVVAEVRLVTSDCLVLAVEPLGVKVELPDSVNPDAPRYIHLDLTHVASIVRETDARSTRH